MSDQQISEAIQLARQGELNAARRIFVELLEQQPQHELAWLWLGRILPDKGQRHYCLERVLKINPRNQEAREALRVLNLNSEPHKPQAHAAKGLQGRRLGDYLVDMGYVPREAVERVAAQQARLREQGKETTIGNILLEWHLITHEQLYVAVREQGEAQEE